MGCTIYAASPKALPADEAPGQDRYYQLPQYRHPHGNCSQRIAASRARSVSSAEEVRGRVCVVSPASGVDSGSEHHLVSGWRNGKSHRGMIQTRVLGFLFY